MKKILYIIAAGAMLLASCSKENSSPETDSSAVRFSTEIATRASGTAWNATDQIGVFMKATGGDISTSEGLNASNVKYTYSASGFTSTTPIYYPQAGNVDFVAYYPWRTKPAIDPYIYKVSVADQTTPAAIDLLWSANATNVARSKTVVPLTFNHKLSRMVLNIKAGEGMVAPYLAGVTVKITGMPTKVDFKLADGGFETPTDVANITPRTVTAGTTYNAIIIPQAGTTGRKMIFTVGTDVYEYAIPASDDFASGKNYPYTVTVKKTGVSVSQGTITDWAGTTDTPGDLGEGEQMDIPIAIVRIPAGSFMMGCPQGEPGRANDQPQHKVTLTKDFYMGKYTITFAQYDAYCDDTGEMKPNRNGGSDNHPVISVNWDHAVAYCAWLSSKTGGTWRLPTEAEWEYACRGDYPDKATETKTMPFGLGDGTKMEKSLANFRWRYAYKLPNGSYLRDDGDSPGPSPVGSYPPNNYGLYDMHGNVFEWCSDWYHPVYGSDPKYVVTDPTGPTEEPTSPSRIVRGAHWGETSTNIRSAHRHTRTQGNISNNIGFRVVFIP